MGKNFSGNNLGQRRKSDFYETPYSMTRAILDRLPMERYRVVLEPACGNGAILHELRLHPHKPPHVHAFDLCLGKEKKDFLTSTTQADLIITNPPYSLAREFILKAKELANHNIAFLLPLSYLHGKQRFEEIWKDKVFPLKEVHVFTRYPLLGDPLREDGQYRTGMMVYAWFVWEKSYSGDPRISWIDNDAFVLKREN